ncbi:competence/damage-inducible protein A [Vallitalea maricola]|uniref:Competence/damage-inducible protein A n=1 Tax=Vallitalea maricola TaxID=3074433 RepID=A0ACB5URF9_9FIRM|nr:competence/damage-inducible protein A [Vallitalea sp. AN17-2]
MTAEIIAIGTELLLGDILNTNARYLSRQLADMGISVYYQSVVGDNVDRLQETIENAMNRTSIIITTGGLGPTTDDLSKETIAQVLGLPLIEHEESKKRIVDFFKQRDICMTENNLKQAYIPEGAVVLENDNGTAPGFIVKTKKNIIIVLPGPPSEMIPMFENGVKKELKKLNEGVIFSRTLKLCGIGESTVANILQDVIDNQTNPTIAPYAKDGEVHLRITAKTNKESEAIKFIDDMEQKVADHVGEYIYTTDEKTLEETIVDIMKNKNLTLSVAESCTGGLLSGRIINCSGVSDVYKEGFITYSNEAKMKYLGVKKDILEEYGAVSEETAREMAEGLIDECNTSASISITGIAGPTGGTEEKPIGLVYIGVSYKGVTTVKKCNFYGNRQKIRTRAVVESLIILWNRIK